MLLTDVLQMKASLTRRHADTPAWPRNTAHIAPDDRLSDAVMTTESVFSIDYSVIVMCFITPEVYIMASVTCGGAAHTGDEPRYI